MHPVLLNILLPGLCPFLAAIAVTYALGWAFRRSPRLEQLPAGFGIAAGFASGFVLLRGWPGFPPTDSANWLLFAAPIGIVAGVWRNRPYRIAVATLSAVALCALVLIPVFKSAYEKHEVSAFFGAAWFIAVVHVIALRKSGERAGVLTPAAALLTTLVFLAFAIVLSRSAAYGQLAGAIASAFAGAAAAVLFARGDRPASLEPAWIAAIALAAGLMAASGFFAQLPTGPALIIASAPLLSWVGALIVRGGQPAGIGRNLAAAACAGCLAAIACGGALWWIAKLIPPFEAYEI